MSIPKQRIEIFRQHISLYDLDGLSMIEAIDYLQEMVETYGIPPDAKFDWGYDNQDDEKSLKMVIERFETDEEAKVRQDKALEESNRKRRIQEEVDRRAYEALRLRFEVK